MFHSLLWLESPELTEGSGSFQIIFICAITSKVIVCLSQAELLNTLFKEIADGPIFSFRQLPKITVHRIIGNGRPAKHDEITAGLQCFDNLSQNIAADSLVAVFDLGVVWGADSSHLRDLLLRHVLLEADLCDPFTNLDTKVFLCQLSSPSVKFLLYDS